VVDAPLHNVPAAEILDRLAARLGDNGQVLITDAAPRWDKITQGDTGDWEISGGPAWFTARRDQARLRIGILREIPAGNDPLLAGADLLTIAVRHQMYAGLTGVPFYGDGGSTATLLLDAVISVRGRQPLRKWEDKAAPAVNEDAWPGGGGWPDQPGKHPHAVTLDRNAQYLSAVNGTHLPLDAPRRTGAIPFDQHLSGYWQIAMMPNPEPRLPHPAGRNVSPAGLRWVTTPTVQLLAFLGAEITVTDSWTCPRDRCRRVMDPWYQVLRDARAELLATPDRGGDTAALLEAVKDTYSRGISHLDRSPLRRWYRPDWRNTLFASARCSMWRSLWVAGTVHSVWPVLVKTDSATYEQENAPAAFKIGTGMGEWKVRSLNDPDSAFLGRAARAGHFGYVARAGMRSSAVVRAGPDRRVR
jgi:hypothetical protein